VLHGENLVVAVGGGVVVERVAVEGVCGERGGELPDGVVCDADGSRC